MAPPKRWHATAFFPLLAVIALGCVAPDRPATTTTADTTMTSERRPPASESAQPQETITITGTVTNEGVECPAVRTAEGTLYTIAGGDREKLKPGVRVRITGTRAEMSFCMQGTTIDATKVEILS